MPCVDQRWLGGMLTNFKTVKGSLKKLKDMAGHRSRPAPSIRCTKKEQLLFQPRDRPSFEELIGGIQARTRAARTRSS